MAVNCGSSSIKYKLFEMPEEKVICSGLIERIGHEDAVFTIKYDGKKKTETLPILDHAKGVSLILNALIECGIVSSLSEIEAVGHRVVLGGKYFKDSVLFNEENEKKIASMNPLAPLHNPANLVGFHSFKEALPSATEVAVFDTAFHGTMEEEDYTYPIPYELSEKYDARRYGFHGTSHKYLSEIGVKKYGAKKIIVCHLGSGASICAVKDGNSVATSMGLTPLAGIMMVSRLSSANPSSAIGYELDAICATVLGGTSISGGKGKLGGALLGAIAIQMLRNGMNIIGLRIVSQKMIIGLVLIIILVIDVLRKESK